MVIHKITHTLHMFYFREKYQDTPGSSSIYQNAPGSSKLPNYPHVQKSTLYKVIIHSNLQALFTKDGRNGPELALFTKDLSV